MGNRQALTEMGEKILDAVRTELYLSMPFMGPALGSFSFVMDLSTASVGTDAVCIRYNPNYLMIRYMERPLDLNRTYMHMVLHCLLRHMYSVREYMDHELWNLCCDIAVESVIDGLEYEGVFRIVTDKRAGIYRELSEKVQIITAQRLYRYFSEGKRDYLAESALAAEFCADDHSFWERMNEQRPEKEAGTAPAPSLSEKDWEKKLEQVRTKLQKQGKEAGKNLEGGLLRSLRAGRPSGTDYREFLRRFMVVREETGIDPDSFDYGFYHYGMKLYGNMPLIEENEVRERMRVEEMVIAIDTSASCQPRLVQEFLNETAAILLGGESFFRKVRIHVLQCDEQVRSYVLITDREEMRRYTQDIRISGGAGTDFRPVFSYAEKLRKEGRSGKVKGLMYFTDGYGTFPSKPAAYDTAFVFDAGADNNDDAVPDWALKLYFCKGKPRG